MLLLLLLSPTLTNLPTPLLVNVLIDVLILFLPVCTVVRLTLKNDSNILCLPFFFLLSYVVNELVETERQYVNDLRFAVEVRFNHVVVVVVVVVVVLTR